MLAARQLARRAKGCAPIGWRACGTAELAVDRGALREYRGADRSGDAAKSKRTALNDQLEAMILARGPLSVAEYMHKALTHPEHGYYTTRTVFGPEGDFVTAPEVFSVFGELVGIWCISMWEQMGRPSSVRLVELGPGRGKLMRDLLRIARRFPEFYAALTIHMCDASPALMDLQQEAIGAAPMEAPALAEELRHMGFHATETGPTGALGRTAQEARELESLLRDAGSGAVSVAQLEQKLQERTRLPPLRSLRVPGGPAVHWHHAFDDVPEGPSLVVAQEFFDALPVHQFEFTAQGWVERLVDVAEAGDPHHLRYVLSPHATPAASTLVLGRKGDLTVAAESLRRQAEALASAAREATGEEGGAVGPTGGQGGDTAAAAEPGDASEGERDRVRVRIGPAAFQPAQTRRLDDETVGDRVEVSAKSIVTMQEVAVRVARHGGGALVVDYGHDHASADSLRGIRRHQFTHPLEAPGESDLTADVDFCALRRAGLRAGEGAVTAWGPVTQSEFLHSMGIAPRMAQLLQAHEEDEDMQDRLMECYKRLTDAEEMGTTYKVLAVVNREVRCAPGFSMAQGHFGVE